MKNLTTFILTTFLFIGCATSPQDASNRPPKHVGRVKTAAFDTTARQVTTELEVFDETKKLDRPHKVIALLTAEGAANEEGDLVNAMMFKARQLGANAVVMLPPDRPNAGVVFNNILQPADRRVFRGNAVVYKE